MFEINPTSTQQTRGCPLPEKKRRGAGVRETARTPHGEDQDPCAKGHGTSTQVPGRHLARGPKEQLGPRPWSACTRGQAPAAEASAGSARAQWEDPQEGACSSQPARPVGTLCWQSSQALVGSDQSTEGRHHPVAGSQQAARVLSDQLVPPAYLSPQQKVRHGREGLHVTAPRAWSRAGAQKRGQLSQMKLQHQGSLNFQKMLKSHQVLNILCGTLVFWTTHTHKATLTGQSGQTWYGAALHLPSRAAPHLCPTRPKREHPTPTSACLRQTQAGPDSDPHYSSQPLCKRADNRISCLPVLTKGLVWWEVRSNNCLTPTCWCHRQLTSSRCPMPTPCKPELQASYLPPFSQRVHVCSGQWAPLTTCFTPWRVTT